MPPLNLCELYNLNKKKRTWSCRRSRCYSRKYKNRRPKINVMWVWLEETISLLFTKNQKQLQWEITTYMGMNGQVLLVVVVVSSILCYINGRNISHSIFAFYVYWKIFSYPFWPYFASHIIHIYSDFTANTDIQCGLAIISTYNIRDFSTIWSNTLQFHVP